MKKLMSFLVIGSFTSLLTVNETSCFCSKRREPPSSTISIANKSLMPIDSSKNDVKNNSAEQIYKEVRTQIASWGNNLTQADIKNDDKIILEIHDQNDLIEETSTYEFQTENYTAKITVLSNDEYFKAQSETDYPFEINRIPIDISNKTFNNFASDAANNIYINISTEVASWSIPKITQQTLDGDNKITIGLYNGQTYIEKSDTTVLSAGDYTVKITVDSNDEYFKAQSETNYNLTISSESKKDISSETFNDYPLADNNKGADLYQHVFSQVASWYSTSLTGSDIENDTEINIEIKFSNGDAVVNSTSQEIEIGNYSVEITVSGNDQYFKQQSLTTYDLVATGKKNIDFESLADYYYDPVKYGKDLWAEIYRQIAGWYSPNLDPQKIKDDPNFELEYIYSFKYDDDIRDNDTQTLINDDSYDAVFFVYTGDIYFEEYLGGGSSFNGYENT